MRGFPFDQFILWRYKPMSKDIEDWGNWGFFSTACSLLLLETVCVVESKIGCFVNFTVCMKSIAQQTSHWRKIIIYVPTTVVLKSKGLAVVFFLTFSNNGATIGLVFYRAYLIALKKPQYTVTER